MKKLLLLLLLINSLVFGGKFLMPDEAFIPSASIDGDTINLEVNIGEDIYLYSDKFKVEVVDSDGITAKNVALPEAHDHDGDMVYTSSPQVAITLAKDANVSGTQKVNVKVSFQGCSEQGLCYEPMDKTFSFDVDTNILSITRVEHVKKIVSDSVGISSVVTPSKPLDLTTAETNETAFANEDISETDKIQDLLKNQNILLVLAAFFGIGVALSLTPCIFPMIPILSSIIASQGENLSAKRGFILAFVYVLFMALAYAFIGFFVGAFGGNLQTDLQNPIALSIFALIFVALAFSMFGFYEIGLPSSWQSKLTGASDNASAKGGFVGVAVMGFLSALIVGPCAAPGLSGAFLYIGQTGDSALGAAALFVMGFGMGLPLLVVGAGAGTFMPKPGGWMNKVTIVFGVVMLGIAIEMISRVIPSQITMYLWALLFIGSAVYMGAFEALEVGKRSWNALIKTVAIIFALYGSIIFVGGLTGATSLSKPLEKIISSNATTNLTTVEQSLSFKKISSLAELERVLDENKGKKILLDFAADWCVACKEYEEITFKDPTVIKKMNEFVLLRADITKSSPEDKALTKKFKLIGPPGIVFFDENGKEIKSKTIIGYQAPEAFLDHLNKI